MNICVLVIGRCFPLFAGQFVDLSDERIVGLLHAAEEYGGKDGSNAKPDTEE